MDVGLEGSKASAWSMVVRDAVKNTIKWLAIGKCFKNTSAGGSVFC